MKDIVVVGSGLAGHRVAQALRRQGYSQELTIVGDESEPPYDRPPLSKHLLAGTMEAAEIFFPTGDLDITWRLGSAARRLDTQSRRVELADGSELGYDRLVIATGRAARGWPSQVPAGVYVIRTLADSLAFRREIRRDAPVAIVGAGFIGCEVAATLRELGVAEVTLIDVAPRPMTALGLQASQFAADYHQERGVRLRLGRSVAEFDHDGGRVSAVRLDDGEEIPATTVLLGLGSVPNTAWLEGSGLILHGGAVVCDEYLFASGHDDIVAIGDVAAPPRPIDGASVSVEHWTNARESAELAAVNLLADSSVARQPHVTIPSFWSDQYDLKIKSVGYLDLADTFEVVESDAGPARPSMVVEGRRNGELIAAIVINKNRKFIEYSRALASGLAV